MLKEHEKNSVNYPIAIAFGLICLAILAHLTGGILESLTVRPSAHTHGGPGRLELEKVERNWVQLMCAFQIVSVDLLAVAGVLYLLAFTHNLQPAKSIALGMAVFFALWGVAWLLQLISLKRPKKDYLYLFQWCFWLICSGLLYWGAQSL